MATSIMIVVATVARQVSRLVLRPGNPVSRTQVEGSISASSANKCLTGGQDVALRFGQGIAELVLAVPFQSAV